MATVLVSILTVAFPFFVLISVGYYQVEALGIFLAILAVARIFLLRSSGWASSATLILPVCLLLIALHAIFFNDAALLIFYPVSVNFVLLVLFAGSLLRGPSAIERLARLSDPNLPERGVRYTRNVTRFWCIFFLLNGGVSVYTAVYGSLQTWAIYNGFIVYIFMGLIFAGEWLIRQRVRAEFDA